MLPRVLFVHVPKTGGVSLISGLAEAYGVENCLHFTGRSEFQRFMDMPEQEMQRHRCVMGHIPFPDYLEKGLGEWASVSVMREPVARALSVYHYVVSQPDHPMHTEYTALTVDGYIDKVATDPLLSQIWWLLGSTSLSEGREYLHRYRVLAPYSDYDGFTFAVGDLIGRPLFVERLNVTAYPADADFSPVQKKRLSEILGEEIKLYEWVRREWASRVLTAGRGRADRVVR